MAENDMHVIMYRIMAYLYWCMRESVEPGPARGCASPNPTGTQSSWS